jgi:hypothetical protein
MLVTEIAKEKLPRVARLHHSERSAFHRQRGDPEKLRIAAADLSVLGPDSDVARKGSAIKRRRINQQKR